MYLSTINEWLTKIGSVHSVEIELGLERIKTVAMKLDLQTPSATVITVGGTNGKGSTVAGLEAIYRAQGYRTGEFTSPILFNHNEYVRVNGVNASDEAFCEAYEAIEKARGVTPLTAFEFHTLAALWIFKQYSLDVILLEVGLGGRLDAVNMVDADVAVVTSVSLDHTEWLGETREKIGFEKAGIFRKGKPAVCGDEEPPRSLVEYAEEIGAEFLQIPPGPPFSKGGNFVVTHFDNGEQGGIYPTIQTNLHTILAVIEVLQPNLKVEQAAIDRGLQNVNLTGRIQIIPGNVTNIFDVSHNIASVALLAEKLKATPCSGKTIAVFSMLIDKDIAGCVEKIKSQIDEWCIAPLATKRAAPIEKLEEIFREKKISGFISFTSIKDAYVHAKKTAISGDRIIIFGSFHTVAEGVCYERTSEGNTD